MNRIIMMLIACVILASQPVWAAADRHGGGRGSRHGGARSMQSSGSRRPGVGAGGAHSRPAHKFNHNAGKHRPQVRPSGNKRPTGVGRPGSITRPGHNNSHKPNNNHKPNGNRPGVHNPGNHQPGGNHGFRPDQRPGRPGNGLRPDRPGNKPGHRPGHGPAPQPNHRPNHRPGHGHGYGHVPPPPMPWHRPAPPPRWRPPHGVPSVGTFLGITFGTALAATLSQLAANNVAVAAYDNSAILLNNVTMYAVTWPQARMLYNNGVLYGSQFFYPTSYYDPSYYDRAYATLVNTYGYPVSYTPLTNGYSTTWFGGSGGFITLSFQPGAGGGYYTSLSIGN